MELINPKDVWNDFENDSEQGVVFNKSEILDIIIEGSKRAREVTKKNLELIKEAMSLNFK